MGDTIVIVVSIILAAILMFVFPMLQMASNNDNIAQAAVQGEVAEFTSETAARGNMTMEQYDKFLQTLHATGNTYDVEFEIQIADGNSDKKTTTIEATLSGEQEFYSIFTDEVISRLEKEGIIVLKKGDIITITVKNTNRTIFQTLQSAFASTPSDSSQIIAKSSATVGANGQ